MIKFHYKTKTKIKVYLQLVPSLVVLIHFEMIVIRSGGFVFVQ